MPRVHLKSAALALATLASSALAFPGTPAVSLEAILAEASRKPPAPADGVSIAVAERDGAGPIIFGRNAGTPLTIASVSKIFSTAAALQGLGRDYRFKTSLYRSGNIDSGVLAGSLLVVGGGDPNISGRFYDQNIHAVFDQWADGLRTAGITRIGGDVILNSTFFDSDYRGPGWPAGQEARWYQAPVAALSYNDNCISVLVGPGEKPGARARVWIEPPADFLRLAASVKTISSRREPRVAVARNYGSPVVSVTGRISSRSGAWSTVIAIDDPPRFFGAVLRERLEERGIHIDGRIVEGGVRPDPTWGLVATTTSDLVPSIAVANKRSQSFYAEQIFKTLAAEKAGAGTWEKALGLERQFIASLGLDPSRYDLHDGSGLDPRNRVAAVDIVHFLRAMAAAPEAPDWVPTLAVSGAPDGSLRHRLRDRISAGNVHAKTGSLDRVNSLAGYATAASGRTYAFAIVLNGRRVDDGSGHAFEDRVLHALLAHG